MLYTDKRGGGGELQMISSLIASKMCCCGPMEANNSNWLQIQNGTAKQSLECTLGSSMQLLCFLAC